MTNVGQQLRYLRTKAGLTLAAVERKSGVSFQYLSRVERGHRLPSLKMLEKLAMAYNWNLVVTFLPKGQSR